MNAMIKKYSSKNLIFKMSSCKRYISVYVDGIFNGFIWNTDKVIWVNGDEVVSSDFFK